MMRCCAIVAVVACFALGCEADPLTEIMVVVDSDLRVSEELDRIEIEVIEPGGKIRTASAELTDAGASLPRELGLVHRGGPLGPLEITAVGSHAGDVVVERIARVSFLRGRTMVLRMDLLRGCVALECGAGETCAEGGCRPIDVGDDELTPRGEDNESVVVPPVGAADAGMDSGGTGTSRDAEPSMVSDAIVDTGFDAAPALDAGPGDGGPAGGPPDATGTAPLNCASGATCDLACAPGGCDVRCLKQAACEVACPKGGCHVTYAVGAVCNVDCAGGGCDVDCQRDATCALTDCAAGGCTCTGMGSCK